MIKKNDDEKEKQQHIVTDRRYNMISISMNTGNKRTIYQHSQPIDSLPIISVYECVYALARVMRTSDCRVESLFKSMVFFFPLQMRKE